MKWTRILTRLRKIGRILLGTIVIVFFGLFILDVCIQLEAHFISKPFWKPPLLTGLVIAMTYLIIGYALNQLLMILTSYVQLLVALGSIISALITIAHNLWIRRKPPDGYIVVTEKE